jgi:hypothetical protein
MEQVKDTFTLHLASWQKRMIQDFVGAKQKADTVKIKPGVIRCPASYLIPIEGLSRHDWVLYLTDEQMSIVKDRLKLPAAIHGINITKSLLDNQSITFM